MKSRIYSRSIFRNHQHFSPVYLMGTVEQTLKLIDIRLIPALIQVPPLNHRNFGQMGVFVILRHIMISHHGISGRIFLADGRFQGTGYFFSKAVVIFQLLAFDIRATQKNLIHIPPNHNRRTVEILTYHFFSHLNGVLQKLFSFRNSIDNGDFNRSHNTQFITHFHDYRILGIM